MKLVLSRKGFDSANGGMPSPILPDGRLLPLPIPSKSDRRTFADLHAPDMDMDKMLSDLSKGTHRLRSRVHLDPHLDRPRAARPVGWRPALGQTGAAHSHLEKQGVGKGDVFLFFGWFREVEQSEGAWRYVKRAPHQHVMFGWIEVDDVLPVFSARRRCLAAHPWIHDHVHVADPKHYDNPLNHLYIAAQTSRFAARRIQGGGPFTQMDDSLVLTKKGHSRSIWDLPGWFNPGTSKPALSYHQKLDRWQVEKSRVQLKSAAIGQEFVIDGKHYPQLENWTGEIIAKNA